MNRKIQVICITGTTRSGSTLLSRILNEIAGIFNAGEVIEFWNKGHEWPCSCGMNIENCNIWNKILKNIKNGNIDIDKIKYKIIDEAHTYKLPKYILSKKARNTYNIKEKELLNALLYLYRQIQLISNCNIIVDASKNPAYAFFLSLIPDIDLYIIHLTRDPRAVAYSWQKKKQDLWKENIYKVSVIWTLRNAMTELIGAKNKYMRIYYEDMIQEHNNILEKLLHFIEIDPQESPLDKEGNIFLGVNHGLCGNPDRYKTGKTKLKIDNAWRNMNVIDKISINILTMPILWRYKYRLY